MFKEARAVTNTTSNTIPNYDLTFTGYTGLMQIVVTALRKHLDCLEVEINYSKFRYVRKAGMIHFHTTIIVKGLSKYS